MEKTLVKALDLVEVLSRKAEPVGVSALARELGLTKSNVHRLLETLRAQGYVRRHESEGRYELTLKLWLVGVAVHARLDLGRVALPSMRELADASEESVNLSMRDGDEVVYVAAVEGRNPIRAVFKVGDRRPIYCTATGKLLLAHLPDDAVRGYCERVTMQRFTRRTLTDYPSLVREMAAIRRQGCAYNLGEWRDSVSGVAAPVRDAAGNVIAAVGLMCPADRLKASARERQARALIDCATRISAALGWSEADAATRRSAGAAGGAPEAAGMTKPEEARQ